MRQIAAAASIRKACIVVLVLLTVAIPLKFLLPASGAELAQRSLTLSSPVAGRVTQQDVRFNLITAGNLGSIRLSYCDNSPFTTDACNAPVGLNTDAVTLINQMGVSGFTVDATGTTANQILLTRTPQAAVPSSVQFLLGAITNPTNPGSYFVRIQTFASTDASGSATDYGSVVFAINTDVSISAEVPPYLTFCTAASIPTLNCSSADGDYINFGELTSTRATQGTSQMMAATNAEDGYNISVAGTTLTSGNNVVDALAASDVSRPGNAQFGLNLRANSAPAGGVEPAGPGVGIPVPQYNQPNFFRFVSNDTIVTTPEPDDMRRYTASYLVNVPRSQPPGIYVSTLTYICFGNF